MYPFVNSLYKALLSALLAAVLLCGCTAKGSADIRLTDSGYTTDSAEIHAQGFEVSGIKNHDFAAQINSSVQSDIDGALVSFDTMVSESLGELRMGNRCILDITQELKYNENDFLSVVEEHYVYTGGAHGSNMKYPRNYDLAGSRQIYLSDLFSEGYKESLNRIITEQVQADTEKYSELGERPEIQPEHEMNFYIIPGKLVIFFQPYELSYYAKGYVEFEIPFSKISGNLKDEWRNRFKLSNEK